MIYCYCDMMWYPFLNCPNGNITRRIKWGEYNWKRQVSVYGLRKRYFCCFCVWIRTLTEIQIIRKADTFTSSLFTITYYLIDKFRKRRVKSDVWCLLRNTKIMCGFHATNSLCYKKANWRRNKTNCYVSRFYFSVLAGWTHSMTHEEEVTERCRKASGSDVRNFLK